jgi:hypothetical protein
MFLIREKTLMLAAATTAASVLGLGCASSKCPCLRQNPPVVSRTMAPVAEQPGEDQATELRGYHKSFALYESGATEAWPTRWYYDPNPNYSTERAIPTESLMFLAQTASLPVTMALEPPFKKPVIYAGDVIPPSYTAMPPLLPEQAISLKTPDPDPLEKRPRPVVPALPPVQEEHAPLYVPPAPVRPMKGKPAPMVAPTTMPSK